MTRYHLYIDGVLAYRSGINEEAYQIVGPQLNMEINKTSTFSFSMLPSNVCYDAITPMQTQIRVTNDERELFRGRVVSMSTDIYGERKVECEDAMSYLLDSVFIPEAATRAMTKNGESVGSGTGALTDIVSLLNDISSGNYSGVAQTVGTNVTQALTDVWGKVKDTASTAATYLSQNGSVSGAVSAFIQDYFSGSSGSSSGSSGSSSSSTEVTKETLVEFFQRILLSHNTQVEPYKRIWPGVVNIDGMNEKKEFGAESICDSRSALENGLIKEYQGFFKLRYVGDDAFLDYVKDYGEVTDQIIQIGVNLEEITYNEETENVFSVLLPLGKNNGTIARANDGSMFIEVPEMIEKIGRVVLIKQWSDLSDASEVKRKAEDYIATHCTGIPTRMDVKAIDMHLVNDQIDELCLGDMVDVYAPRRGIDVKKMILKIGMDFQNPENNTYTIGDYKVDDDGTTASYHNKQWSLSALMNEADKDGKIFRENLQFRIAGQLSLIGDRILISAENVAQSFTPREAGYDVNSYCRVPEGEPNAGKLVRCISKVNANEEWDASKWEDASVSDGLINVYSNIERHQTNLYELTLAQSQTDLALLRIEANIADEFDESPSKHYDRGTYVLRNGKMYVARNDTTGGTFNEWDWEQTNAGNGFMAVNGTLYAVKAELEELIADKITAMEANISWLNGRTITTGSVIANYGNFSTLQFGGQTVATQPWVQSYCQSYCTWANIANKPTFNQYSITDTYGNTYTVYGP